MEEMEKIRLNFTYPAPFLLGDVEIIQDEERSEVLVRCNVTGLSTVSQVAVVVLVVMRRVLHLVEDNAGGGHAGPL